MGYSVVTGITVSSWAKPMISTDMSRVSLISGLEIRGTPVISYGPAALLEVLAGETHRYLLSISQTGFMRRTAELQGNPAGVSQRHCESHDLWAESAG